MGGIAPTSSIVPSNYTGQSSSTAYPVNIDGNAIAGLRIWGNAAPRTWPTPNMTLSIDPTHLFNGGSNPVELGAWATGNSSTSTNTLTSVSNTTGVSVGMSVLAYAYVSGTFTQATPTNAIVTNIAGSTITFSGGNGLATATGATVIFGQPIGMVVTGNAHGTQILDGLQSTAGIFVGMAVSGTGVSGGTTVSSVDSASQVHVSANVTAGTGVSFTFSVPTQTGNPRIDRVVQNQATGTVQWLMGTAAASPAPPAIPASCSPLCQLAIATSTTAITSTSVVMDERDLTALTTSGSFTPVLAGSVVAGTPTYSTQTGRYVKIAPNLIWISLRIIITAMSGSPSGNTIITGLPFSSSNIFGLAAALQIITAKVTLDTGYSYLVPVITVNSNQIVLEEVGSNQWFQPVQIANVASDADLTITGIYSTGLS